MRTIEQLVDFETEDGAHTARLLLHIKVSWEDDPGAHPDGPKPLVMHVDSVELKECDPPLPEEYQEQLKAFVHAYDFEFDAESFA